MPSSCTFAPKQFLIVATGIESVNVSSAVSIVRVIVVYHLNHVATLDG